MTLQELFKNRICALDSSKTSGLGTARVPYSSSDGTLTDYDKYKFVELSSQLQSDNSLVYNNAVLGVVTAERLYLGGTYTNLITNPSCELPLSSGEIQNWTEAVGSTWTAQSSSPVARDGTYYFAPGNVANAELTQTIDVSGISGTAAGTAKFIFRGYLYTVPSDQAQVSIQCLDASNVVLSTTTTGLVGTNSIWTLYTLKFTTAATTTQIKIRLIGSRATGTPCDTFFDGLFLGVDNYTTTLENGALKVVSLNVNDVAAISSIGDITGVSVNVSGSGIFGTGLTSASLNTGAITSTSVSAGSGSISTSGSVLAGTSVILGASTIVLTGSSGAIACASLNSGSGTIQTTGSVTVGASITLTGSTGAIACASLNSGSGTIQTTGQVSSGTMLTSGNVTFSGIINAGSTPKAITDSAGNLVSSVISLTATRVPYGSGSNLVTSVDKFTYDDSDGLILGTSGNARNIKVYGLMYAGSTPTAFTNSTGKLLETRINAGSNNQILKTISGTPTWVDESSISGSSAIVTNAFVNAPEIFTNTTTLTPISNLTFSSIPNGSSWVFEGYVYYTITGTTSGDAKFDLYSTSQVGYGSAYAIEQWGDSSGASAMKERVFDSSLIDDDFFNGASSVQYNFSSAVPNGFLRITGALYNNSGSSMSLAVRCAQRAVSATSDVKVHAGSFMRWTRVS